MANQHFRPTRRTLLRGLAAGSAACVFGDLAAAPPAGAAGAGGRGRLPRVHPTGVGIDPAAVAAFVEGVEQKVGGLHSFMLLRHGQVAAEGWWSPYAPEHPHMLFSLSKSFTSTAVGLAVAEGRLTVEDRVISFFGEDLPATVGENLRAMRVRHLLSMGTGHEKDATGPTRADGDNWVRSFLALPVEHAPGSRFVYNSAATYMCSAIVQKLTGETLLDYLTPRLFEPLGIRNPTWESCPRGINTGGWGLSIRTEDIARFGQLYLQRGKWGDRQLITESWVAEATGKQIANGTNPNSDWNQGYGYQFWRCRHGAFRGDGAFGQYCVVMPEQDAVLAITSGVGDMQAVLNVAWERLLPGMVTSGAAPEHPDGELKRKLKALELRAPEGSAASPTGKRVSGRTFRFDANDEKLESATVTFREERGGRCSVLLKDDRGERRIECSGSEWLKGTAPLGDRRAAPIAARGAWLDDATYVMKLCYYDTPFVQTLTWKFTDHGVTVARKMNVGFGPTDRPALVGKLTL